MGHWEELGLIVIKSTYWEINRNPILYKLAGNHTKQKNKVKWDTICRYKQWISFCPFDWNLWVLFWNCWLCFKTLNSSSSIFYPIVIVWTELLQSCFLRWRSKKGWWRSNILCNQIWGCLLHNLTLLKFWHSGVRRKTKWWKKYLRFLWLLWRQCPLPLSARSCWNNFYF